MIGVLQQDFEVFGNDYNANFLVGNCGIGLAELVYSITGIRQRHRHSADFQGQLRDNTLCEGAIHYRGTLGLMADYALFACDMGLRSLVAAIVKVMTMSQRLHRHMQRHLSGHLTRWRYNRHCASLSWTSLKNLVNAGCWKFCRSPRNKAATQNSAAICTLAKCQLQSRFIICILRPFLRLFLVLFGATTMHAYRSHNCVELSEANVGEKVRLSGWIKQA